MTTLSAFASGGKTSALASLRQGSAGQGTGRAAAQRLAAPVLFASCLASCMSAHAQSSVQIYGTLDLGVDISNKTAGSTRSSDGASSAFVSPPGSTGVHKRLSNWSRTSTFGFKGTEDLGDDLRAGFVIEGQPNIDDGTYAQDNRIFGKQTYVYLKNSNGELRLGRQYAPFFFAFLGATTDGMAATDLFVEGMNGNTLQVRQDNQVSYWLTKGAFTFALSASSNAGVADVISNTRGGAVTAATGSSLGAANAGAEDGGRGRAFGLLLQYDSAKYKLNFAYHYNRFGVPVVSSAGSLFELDRANAMVISGVYFVQPDGLSFHALFHDGRFTDSSTLLFPGQSPITLAGAGNLDPHVQTAIFAVKYPVRSWAFVAQAAETRFANYTRGRDVLFSLGAEYSFSKRTAVYARVSTARDHQGNVLSTLGASSSGVAPIRVAGGPDPVFQAVGLRDVPEFIGVGLNPNGVTSMATVGLRTSF